MELHSSRSAESLSLLVQGNPRGRAGGANNARECQFCLSSFLPCSPSPEISSLRRSLRKVNISRWAVRLINFLTKHQCQWWYQLWVVCLGSWSYRSRFSAVLACTILIRSRIAHEQVSVWFGWRLILDHSCTMGPWYTPPQTSLVLDIVLIGSPAKAQGLDNTVVGMVLSWPWLVTPSTQGGYEATCRQAAPYAQSPRTTKFCLKTRTIENMNICLWPGDNNVPHSKQALQTCDLRNEISLRYICR